MASLDCEAFWTQIERSQRSFAEVALLLVSALAVPAGFDRLLLG